jgi:hypothetical protein
VTAFSPTFLSCTTTTNGGSVRLQLMETLYEPWIRQTSHRVYKHWEYQSFALVQVDPLAQHVAPAHPLPYTLLGRDHSFYRIVDIDLRRTGHSEPHKHQ